MNKDWAAAAFTAIFFFAYAFGMYTLIVSDRYTAKQTVISLIIFPYPMWISAKEAYRFATTTTDERKIENTCWSRLVNTPLAQSDKEEFCDCLIKKQNAETCAAQVSNSQ